MFTLRNAVLLRSFDTGPFMNDAVCVQVCLKFMGKKFLSIISSNNFDSGVKLILDKSKKVR